MTGGTLLLLSLSLTAGIRIVPNAGAAETSPEARGGAVVYYFIDDGGDHGYPDSCTRTTANDPVYARVRKKLKKADPRKGVLGSYTEEGEGGDAVKSFFSQSAACEGALKKAREWYDKEFGSKKE